MNLCVIYDDRACMGDEVAGLVGVRRFGQVLFRKRSLLEHAKELLRDAGGDEFFHLVRDNDLDVFRNLSGRAGPGTRFLYYPSCIVPTNLPRAAAFLKKIQYSRRDLIVLVQADPPGPPVMLLSERGLSAHLDTLTRAHWQLLGRAAGPSHARNPAGLSHVPNHALLRDISSPDRFLAYLSSNFDARHFNRVVHEGPAIVKHSADAVKLEREYSFLRLVDGPMQPFFLRPYDFRKEPAGASYRMERLRVPDMAMQWIHGALSLAEFRVFLGRVREYFELRPVRPCSAQEFAAAGDAVFARKIADRNALLTSLPLARTLDPLIERCTPYGSVAEQSRRWIALFERHKAMLGSPRLAFTHGDPCFSNILYDKRTGVMKLIDPRGAASADELFGHPWYDAAKLSHSVLGGYDFINQGVTLPHFAPDLRLGLDTPPRDTTPYARAFTGLMEQLGFDARLLRVLEASLFLSMLPLHADAPRKVLALFLAGCAIMDDVESLS